MVFVQKSQFNHFQFSISNFLTVPSNIEQQINKRRTFAIISHPDAGKTTITERLLLLGDAIQTAGVVKAKNNQRQAHSDWMQIEAERGISVTTAVMKFQFKDFTVNLLDTPGHQDFSEDTYRTLTAVDSVLMVIDSVKGVEERTIKLMQVCRMRNIPISTFINKVDRDGLDGIDLLDQIESVLGIEAVPMNWPIGMGNQFKGCINLQDNTINEFIDKNQQQAEIYTFSEKKLAELAPFYAENLEQDLELMRSASLEFSTEKFLAGTQTPVYFGTALYNFGVEQWLDNYLAMAPKPQPRETTTALIQPNDQQFSGFVFKIQANMDPKHRDRIAFLRICSGQYQRGLKCIQQRTGKEIKIANAVTFNAENRSIVDASVAGDIIGIYNHGNIQIGDSFYQTQAIKFTGIPNFAPEIFQTVILKNPMKSKQLRNGLLQLAEEGSVQVFFPLDSGQFILGVVGTLQFDLVAFRLLHEYKVEASYQSIKISSTRWFKSSNTAQITEFKARYSQHIAIDGGNFDTYLAPSSAHLQMMQQKYADIEFLTVREH